MQQQQRDDSPLFATSLARASVSILDDFVELAEVSGRDHAIRLIEHQRQQRRQRAQVRIALRDHFPQTEWANNSV